MPQTYKQQGFVLLSLILAIVIIVILVVLYFKNPSAEKSTFEAGQQGMEQAKQNKDTLLNQQIDIQNQLNSIDQ